MVRRSFTLLLVLLLLANQGLFMAHTHHTADAAEPDGHACRTHFHIGGHGHHDSTHDLVADHSHGHDSDDDAPTEDHNGDFDPFIRPALEHDADAVYCTETVMLAQDGRTPSVVSVTDDAASAVFRVAHQNDDGMLRLGPAHGPSASVFDAACPIYLRVLSLRI